MHHFTCRTDIGNSIATATPFCLYLMHPFTISPSNHYLHRLSSCIDRFPTSAHILHQVLPAIPLARPQFTHGTGETGVPPRHPAFANPYQCMKV